MLFESCGDPWMRQLEQRRAARAEKQRRFAVDPPTHGRGPKTPAAGRHRVRAVRALDGSDQRLAVAPRNDGRPIFMNGELHLSLGRRTLFHRCLQHRFQAPIDIFLGRCPRRNTDAHGRVSLPDSRSAPAGSLLLQPGNRSQGSFRAAERHQHLVNDHIIQNLETGRAQIPRQSAARGCRYVPRFPPCPTGRASAGRPTVPRPARAGKVRDCIAMAPSVRLA